MGTEIRQIKLRRGKCVVLSSPCIIILPEDSRLSAVVLAVISDGKIEHHAAPIDDRPRKPR